VALMGAQQPAEALDHFRRAMALSHETADTWNNIGAAYYALHDLDQAISSYQRGLKFDPCHYNTRRNLVMLYAETQRPEAAYRAGEVPDTCHLVPDQAKELDTYRRQVGRP